MVGAAPAAVAWRRVVAGTSAPGLVRGRLVAGASFVAFGLVVGGSSERIALAAASVVAFGHCASFVAAEGSSACLAGLFAGSFDLLGQQPVAGVEVGPFAVGVLVVLVMVQASHD